MMCRQEVGKRYRAAPCRGGGGIFVQPIKFVDNHKKQKTNHSIWKGVKMGIIANYKYLSDKNLKPSIQKKMKLLRRQKSRMGM